MSGMAVVVRELRVESRRPWTLGVRLAGAGVAVALLVLSLDSRFGLHPGQPLFSFLHGACFIAGWWLGPLMTVDCLARERREGTLPLLLLTRLSPAGVVVAKACVQVVRSLSLFLAAVPVAVCIVVLGGVTGQELWAAFLLDFASLIGGLSIGLLVSGCVERLDRASGLAFGLGVVASLAAAALLAGLGSPLVAGQSISVFDEVEGWARVAAILSFTLNAGNEWSGFGLNTPAWLALLWSYWAVMAAAGLGTVGWLGHRLDRPESTDVSSWRQWLWHRLRRLLRMRRSDRKRWRRYWFRRNPVVWLQAYRPGQRWAKWGLMAVMAFAIGMGPSAAEAAEAARYAIWVGGCLLFAMCFVAASSYQWERRAGVLELLLVSPLSAWHLISGRLRGIWSLFLPALILFLIDTWIWVGEGYGHEDRFMIGLFVVIAFLVVPLMGLDASLVFSRYWQALLATAGSVLVVPGVALLYALAGEPVMLAGAIAVHVIVGVLTLTGLELMLRERPRRPRLTRSTLSLYWKQQMGRHPIAERRTR